MKDYVESSLELHLFFARIMKEHAFFMEVGYTDSDCDYKREANEYKVAFEQLLRDVIKCSYGVVDKDVLTSGEIVTEYTMCSENTTCELTGANLDNNITSMEQKLIKTCTKKCSDQCSNDNIALEHEVKMINQRCLQLLKCFIAFKQDTLKRVLKCRMFTMNYPLMIDHLTRESKLYESYVKNLEDIGSCSNKELIEQELFWNQIMMEHALFIRGLLDPTEGELIRTADQFAAIYAKLLNEAQTMSDATMNNIKDESLKATNEYRDFKESGTKGINNCRIKSLISPLLADHVLREANHYLRLLKECD